MAHRGKRRRKSVKAPAVLRPDCGQKKITLRGGREGTCLDFSGHRVKVVNRASLLRLHDMDVKLKSVRVRRAVGTGPYRVQAAGVFVVVTVRIRNNLNGTALFRPAEMLLVLGSDTLVDSSVAEASVADSFVSKGGLIRRNHSRTGSVIFDVPETDAEHLAADGNIVIVQFRDLSYEQAVETVGYFRTYR